MDKTSFALQQAAKSPSVPLAKPPQTSIFIMAQLILRLLALFSTLISISLIVTANQTVTIFTIQFRAHYSYSSAYRFLVGADAVVCAFSALSLMSVFLLRRWESKSAANKHFFLFLHDTVMLVLAVSGCAASTAIGYVGRHGEPHMTWQAVCDEVSQFCRRMFVGSVFSYVAFFAYFALTLLSGRRLISVSQ